MIPTELVEASVCFISFTNGILLLSAFTGTVVTSINKNAAANVMTNLLQTLFELFFIVSP